MEVSGLSLPLVFAAGVVSFISPCVLPLVPGYLATVTGAGLEPVDDRRSTTRQVASGSALFFVGFLAVFVALGASASLIGAFLDDNRDWLNRVAGVLIIVFGLAMLGLGWSGALGGRWTQTVQQAARRRGGPLGLGVAFAFCWTPCVGPILASILVLAGATASLASGVLLLLVYGIGLAMPFVAVGFGLTRVLGSFRRVHRYYCAIEAVAGVLLVAMGALLLSGYLYLFNVYAQHALRALGLDWWTSL